MGEPVRLQLSRRRGFNLQALSLATNGLPAVNVARPSRWGNPHDWRDWRGRVPAELKCEPGWMRDVWCKARAVDAFRETVGCDDFDLLVIPENLRGKNLACWCSTHALGGCHADMLLEIANRPEAPTND